MSSAWHHLAEDRINEAIARGDFSDLPLGQPLDLREYFAQPEAERAGASLLKNAGVVPPEVELLKAVAALERELELCTDPTRAAELRDRLQTNRVALALALERRQKAQRAGL